MNMHTKLSSEGQIAIPKALRDRMGLRAGASFEIVEQGKTLILESNSIRLNRLCERSAAIHTAVQRVDCFVAALLAKTNV